MEVEDGSGLELPDAVTHTVALNEETTETEAEGLSEGLAEYEEEAHPEADARDVAEVL